MMSRISAATVIYAKDLGRVGAFYGAVTGLPVTASHDDHLVLESETYQLVVLRIPAPLARTIQITDPPAGRKDSAVKPVFIVARIDPLRAVAAEHGGALNPPEREWRFQQWRVCDGHDPEGNIIQLRQLEP